jgi:transposase
MVARLTDEEWERLRPLMPPQKPPTGRPRSDHRTVLGGMLWVFGTGASWRDLPAERSSGRGARSTGAIVDGARKDSGSG